MGKMKEKFIQEMNDKMYWDRHCEGYEEAQREMWQIEYERKEQEEQQELQAIQAMEINTTIEQLARIIEERPNDKDTLKEIQEIFINKLKHITNDK